MGCPVHKNTPEVPPNVGLSRRWKEQVGAACRQWPLHVLLPQTLQILPVSLDETEVGLLHPPWGQAYNGKGLLYVETKMGCVLLEFM